MRIHNANPTQMSGMHRRPNFKKFKCSHCPRRYATEELLRRHLQNSCPIKIIQNQRQLQSHKSIRTFVPLNTERLEEELQTEPCDANIPTDLMISGSDNWLEPFEEEPLIPFPSRSNEIKIKCEGASEGDYVIPTNVEIMDSNELSAQGCPNFRCHICDGISYSTTSQLEAHLETTHDLTRVQIKCLVGVSGRVAVKIFFFNFRGSDPPKVFHLGKK